MSKLKKYQNKQTGEIIDSDAEPTLRGNIALWVWRSTSIITGLDFTFYSIPEEEFKRNYAKIIKISIKKLCLQYQYR